MIPELSITENIFLGNEVVKHGLIDWDAARRATIELLKRVGLTVDPNIKWIWEGRQDSTVDKPTATLVGKTMEIIKLMQAGTELPAPDVFVDNGKKEVGIYELTPVIVTKDNAKEVYANDPGRLEILK